MSGYYANKAHLASLSQAGLCAQAAIFECDYAFAIFTGQVCYSTPDEITSFLKGDITYLGTDSANDMGHLLDLRMFGAGGELHAVRSNISEDFSVRTIIDDASDPSFAEGIYDESQIVDPLVYIPFANAKRMLVRNYLDYDADGVASICDFRIVGFERGAN